jgi:hypothetical protein
VCLCCVGTVCCVFASSERRRGPRLPSGLVGCVLSAKATRCRCCWNTSTKVRQQRGIHRATAIAASHHPLTSIAAEACRTCGLDADRGTVRCLPNPEREDGGTESVGTGGDGQYHASHWLLRAGLMSDTCWPVVPVLFLCVSALQPLTRAVTLCCD